MTPHRKVIGIDGGGTKTLALLADGSGRELARHSAGASNVNVVGIEAAGRHLEEAIRGCCAGAQCGPQELDAVVLGLAGAGNAENRQGLQRHLLQSFGERFPLRIETDARIAAEGALGGGPGIVIIAGTGSVVMAKTSGGAVRIVGGWGRTLGDEGSGYFIGLEALKAFARHLDGLLEPSLLPGALKEQFGWDGREKLVHAVYREKAEPSTLAPLVLELAGREDPVCAGILRRGAQALARQAAAALPLVGLERVPAATCGGLIEHPTSYRAILVSELCALDRRFAVQMPEHPAVEGAVLMALSPSGGGAA